VAGTISQETSHAVYDDARRAYSDPDHPCHLFRTLQRKVPDAAWQLPEPFNGAAAAAGIVFLGLNPSYNPDEDVPTIVTPFEEWDAFYRHRLDGDPARWPLLYRRFQQLGQVAVGHDFRLGRDGLVLEIVRFRSAKGEGITEAVLAQERPLTRRLLRDVLPQVIVANGGAVLWELRRVFPALAEKVPADYRMREVTGQIFQVPWGDAAGQVRIVICPHLSGSFGLSQATLTALAEAVGRAWR